MSERRRMFRVRALAGVIRAPFLLLPVTLVTVGAGAAARQGGFDATRAGLALVGLVALHAAVNAFNEASDHRTGIDLRTERTPFSGGSGVLPAGEMPRGAAVAAGVAGSTIGLAIGSWFLLDVGWPLLPYLAFGAAAVLGYTDLFARLHAGELVAGLGLGAVPVLGTVLVQCGRVEPLALVAAVPPFLLTFNLLLLNEFPDEGADRWGGRRNLVLLLGRRRAARLYAVFALGVPAVIAAAVAVRLFPAWSLLAVAPAALASKPARWALVTPDQPVPDAALAANVAWILSTNAVLGLSLFA